MFDNDGSAAEQRSLIVCMPPASWATRWWAHPNGSSRTGA